MTKFGTKPPFAVRSIKVGFGEQQAFGFQDPAVDRMGFGENATLSLPVAIHERATDTMEYGELSILMRTLELSNTSPGDDIIVTWLERGRPPDASADGNGGFGSKLARRSTSRHLC